MYSIYLLTTQIRTTQARAKLARQYEQLFELFPILETDLEYLAADEQRLERFLSYVSGIFTAYMQCGSTDWYSLDKSSCECGPTRRCEDLTNRDTSTDPAEG